MNEWYDIRYEDYSIEVRGASSFWGDKKIIIYDPANDLTEEKEKSIVQYLYEEGFVEDRRTDVEIRV